MYRPGTAQIPASHHIRPEVSGNKIDPTQQTKSDNWYIVCTITDRMMQIPSDTVSERFRRYGGPCSDAESERLGVRDDGHHKDGCMRMSKEMYESLQVKDLKAIADSRDMKIPARTKKEQIVEMLLQLDQAEDERVLRERAAREKEEKEQTEDAGTAEAGPSRNVHGRHGRKTTGRPGGTGENRRGRVRRESAESTGEGQERGGKSPAQEPNGTQQLRESAVREQPVREGSVRENGVREQTARENNVREQSMRENNGREQTARENNAREQSVRENNVREQTARENSVREAAAAGEKGGEGKPVRQDSVSAATAGRYARHGLVRPDQQIVHKNEINPDLDSGDKARGILEVLQDGYGFIRSANYMPGDNDVYVAPSQIRRFNLKTGDIVEGGLRVRNQNEKFSALLYVTAINGLSPEESKKRYNFEDMTPIFPDDRIRLEKPGASVAMRVMDLMCPVGKGQRGMIVSPPKAGKTTLLKEVAKSVKSNNPDIHLIILLIDERPEEVTDIREALEGPNVEVIYSTFDELPDHHKRVAEMTIERAKRLVESKKDVMILLDSITRLTRAYNLTEPSSGRTLSGGLDPVALHMPKRFFGAARNMREGGSLTILATALIETGSKMDDVVYEEFKGTGNMELILNRKLSERRIFPAVDLAKSGTRRDDLLLTPDEREGVALIRKAFIGSKGEEATDSVLDLFARTRSNGEFVSMVKKHMWSF